MVAHRGNLNYQDCRRTVTAGFEPGEMDLLQEAGAGFASVSNKASDYLSSSSSVVPLEASQKGDRVRFSVKITSAVILASEFWKVAGFDWYGQWETAERSQRRAAQFLCAYLSGPMCRALNRTCSKLYRMEFDKSGVADAKRVGDRLLTLEQSTLHGFVKECIVEGIRTGIQTSFYTCDYTTKPSLTCGPVLKHLTNGMERLEATMRAEAEQEEAKRLQLSYPLPPLQEGRGLTAEQREARRRLCRLWTSANHAVMHGFCLMSLQLLTGREVLRTHIFWRVMLKRVLWGVFEEMRRNTEKITDALEVETVLPLDSIDLSAGPVSAGSSVSKEASDTRATSFYEDYLHRGKVEPLASMNLYVYAMHVSSVPLHEAGKFDHGEFDFDAHYGKAKTHVQILHPAPRIPYLHGISMPTKQKDPEMWAAVHIALLRPHFCCNAEQCGKAAAVRHICAIPRKGRVAVVAPGSDYRTVVDRTGVLGEWKVTEARMQCLAQRADATRFQWVCGFMSMLGSQPLMGYRFVYACY